MTDHKPRSQDTARLSKVRFELEASDWHEHGTESMWALPVNSHHYRLENIPFYLYGVSYLDIVSTKRIESNNVFDGVIERGGHSTYRIFLVGEQEPERFTENWSTLRVLGCFYERATDYLVAVDVPPESDIYQVYAALEQGEKLGVWDFEEGYCGHPLR